MHRTSKPTWALLTNTNELSLDIRKRKRPGQPIAVYTHQADKRT